MEYIVSVVGRALGASTTPCAAAVPVTQTRKVRQKRRVHLELPALSTVFYTWVWYTGAADQAWYWPGLSQWTSYRSPPGLSEKEERK